MNYEHSDRQKRDLGFEAPHAKFIQSAEIEYFRRLLERTGGNRRAAAEAAGLKYDTFCRKIKGLGLRIETRVEVRVDG